MTNSPEESRKVAVWVAMADHFLDTETRQDMPRTALRCVEVGLTASDARSIWRLQVTPAVGFNLYCVAGEWAYWDRDWLLSRIRRTPRLGRLDPRSWFGAAWSIGGVCEAIERCVELVSAASPGADRERLVTDLQLLAGHYFDFCPVPLDGMEHADVCRIRALYEAQFRRLMAPSLVKGEAQNAHARLTALFRRALP